MTEVNGEHRGPADAALGIRLAREPLPAGKQLGELSPSGAVFDNPGELLRCGVPEPDAAFGVCENNAVADVRERTRSVAPRFSLAPCRALRCVELTDVPRGYEEQRA